MVPLFELIHETHHAGERVKNDRQLTQIARQVSAPLRGEAGDLGGKCDLIAFSMTVRMAPHRAKRAGDYRVSKKFPANDVSSLESERSA